MPPDGRPIPIRLQDLAQGLPQRRLVPERHDLAQVVPGDHLPISADVGGHHWKAAGHCLQEDVGPAFVPGRQDEDIGRGQGKGQALRGHGSKKAHRTADPQLPRPLPQEDRGIPLRTRAPHHQVLEVWEPGPQVWQHRQHPVDSLALHQGPHRDQDRPVLRQPQGPPGPGPGERPEPPGIHAVGNGLNLCRIRRQLPGQSVE